MQKRGISSIIATVLIILITIAAIIIVWQVVIPLIKNNLLENTGFVQLSIDTSQGYTVWDSSQNKMSVQIKRGIDDVTLDGIRVIFLLDSGSVYSDVTAIGQNQAKTFYFQLSELSRKPDKISIAPIINGKVKDVVFTIKSFPDGKVSSNEPYIPGENGGTPPTPLECRQNTDCDDDNPCTDDTCISGGRCKYSNVAGCYLLSSCGIITTAGNYYLSNDIFELSPAQNSRGCIDIQSSNVNLNCQNCKIEGNNLKIGVISNNPGTIIRNCKISVGDTGIKLVTLDSAILSIIENNQLSNNGYIAVYASGKKIKINDNEITNNYFGLYIENAGSTDDKIEISNNNIIDNNWGVLFIGSSVNFYDNTVCDSSRFDFLCDKGNAESVSYIGSNNKFSFLKKCDGVSWPTGANYEECSGVTKPVCRNNICEAGEDFESCSADCSTEIPAWRGALLGDANLDCKVNILDLIFIRNGLNADVNNNWQADVNVDGRINILDLIFVRNRINAACSTGTKCSDTNYPECAGGCAGKCIK